MILPIRLFTDSILHTQCIPVTDFIEVSTLAQDMIETMFANYGVGLAAPQIGKNLQLMILNLENKSKIICVANCKIICYTKEKDIKLEGCLSSPGINVAIERPLGVEIEGQLLTGEKVQYQFTEYDARVFMHEYEHCQGICIVDRINKL